MKIKAVKCKSCGNILFSRSRHDFRTCKCTKTSVDGGREICIRISYDPNVGYEDLEIEIDATEQELYDDWNKRIDKFGIISET